MVFYNLKVLDVSGSEDLIKTPDLTGAKNLEKLDFSGCRSLWSSIEAIKGLEELRMSGSRIKELWKGLVVFDNLKVLDMSDSKNLIKTPDLTRAPRLENLNLSGCRSLCEIHPSIGSLKRLKELWLNKCSGLKEVARPE
ncbi:disease resistance protein RPP5-like [Juglans microcarpa x Juglans regia]|uniref:disease resistance protein RPP5-like n=1 Tax=Juglans microcarpa x Juglans regia TaxID=2249226 RepID=UPI001B7E09E1|nr:disease resistance protein RPP5-like [Juglans microcarpa x Juglans regia]